MWIFIIPILVIVLIIHIRLKMLTWKIQKLKNEAEISEMINEKLKERE